MKENLYKHYKFMYNYKQKIRSSLGNINVTCCIQFKPPKNQKTLYVSIWSHQSVINLVWFLHANTRQWGGRTGLLHNTCRQRLDLQWAVYAWTVCSRWPLIWLACKSTESVNGPLVRSQRSFLVLATVL